MFIGSCFDQLQMLAFLSKSALEKGKVECRWDNHLFGITFLDGILVSTGFVLD